MPTSIRTPSSEVLAPRPSLRSRAPRACRSRAGFTLLELSIILLVLGIAVSFVIPRLRDADRTRLIASAERLATTARYLYDEAAFRQRPMRLNFDLDNRSYWVSVLNEDPEDPEFVLDGSPLSSPVVLPDAVAFADVVLPALGVVNKGVVFAEFSAEGYADPLVIHLQSKRGEEWTVALDSLTGRTRTGEGYHEIGLRAPGDERESRRSSGDASGRHRFLPEADR
jgi:general secretion pathway protein H